MASLSYDEAAHLLRRMGFGGPPEEIEGLVARGRESAVDYLINYGQIDNTAMENLLRENFDFDDPNRFNQNELRRWWFTRLIHSRRQFEEKLALFWHNHFATSITKVGQLNGLYMYMQNLLFRQYGLDRFDTLLLKASQDPAMLIWLDNITNVLGRPNENFGRELMELFTMGINDVVTGEQNYTEADVKEVARAFTGWDFVRRTPYNFQIRANQHDNGSKTLFAGTPFQVSGNITGEDVISLLCNRRATARYLTKKLFDFFVYPLTSSQQDKQTVDDFADVYMNSNHSMKELVRAIFTSDEFFSERAFFSLVKQPVEIVVGSIRMLGGTYTPGVPNGGRLNTSNTPYLAARNQGQDLFNPPDVAGWDFNLGWVNTASMLERYNSANAYVTNRNTNNPGVFVTTDQLRGYTKKTAKKTAKKFLFVLGPLSAGSETRNMLRDYLETDGGFVNDDATIDKKVRGLVHLIMALPEFQMN